MRINRLIKYWEDNGLDGRFHFFHARILVVMNANEQDAARILNQVILLGREQGDVLLLNGNIESTFPHCQFFGHVIHA